jgi:hypothetical protein
MEEMVDLLLGELGEELEQKMLREVMGMIDRSTYRRPEM